MIRLVAIALLFSAPAAAQVYGLSPAEKTAAIEAASLRVDADNPALLPDLPQDRRPHGEVGVMIGSGGARGIYGVVGVPIGETGSAVIAFSNTRLPGFFGYGPFSAGGPLGQRNISIGLRQPGW